MKPNIRERGQKVADYIKTNVNQTLAAIAAATGVSKSSVHRHQQSIEQRQQYPESDWWETKVGYVYLVRLVVGVIYFFGLEFGNYRSNFSLLLLPLEQAATYPEHRRSEQSLRFN